MPCCAFRLLGRLLYPDSGSYTYLQDLDWTQDCFVVIMIQYDQYMSLVHYIGFLSIFFQPVAKCWKGCGLGFLCQPRVYPELLRK